MEQSACDRATAWNFIIGMVSRNVTASKMRANDSKVLSAKRTRFEALLQRWDTGLYRYHSFATDGIARQSERRSVVPLA